MTETKPKRRWLQFRLRSLFILVTLMALAMPLAVAKYTEWMNRDDEDGPLTHCLETQITFPPITEGPGVSASDDPNDASDEFEKNTEPSMTERLLHWIGFSVHHQSQPISDGVD